MGERQTRWDEEIRHGRLWVVQSELRALELSRVERSRAAELADFARRVQMPEIALKILNPIVRPMVPLQSIASSDEIRLYAIALSQIGAREEAKELLRALNAETDPLVHFAWTYILQSEWNYEASGVFLKKYIRSDQISEYQRLVGRLNLAAGAIFLKNYLQARSHLKIVLREARSQGADLIMGNAFELLAQLELGLNNFTVARQYLKLYRERLPSATLSTYELYHQKWSALIDLKELGITSETQNRIEEVKLLAQKLKDWETMRDLDFHVANVANDREKQMIVYFGTPYPAYRNRFEGRHEFPKAIGFDLLSKKLSHGFCDIDLALGVGRQVSYALKPGGKTHQCLLALMRDLYRPTPLGTLFGVLFPSEYYNPFSSPQRVIQTIYQLNQWFKKNHLPLKIAQDHFQFRIHCFGPISFKIPLESDQFDSTYTRYKILDQELGGKSFRSSSAAKLWGVTVRQARNILALQIARGFVKPIMHGKNHRYILVKAQHEQPIKSRKI